MGSFARLPGIMTAIALGDAALTAAVPAVPAQAQAAAPGQIGLPCSVTALKAAITFAGTHGGGVFQLAANCTYLISTPATAADGLPIITAPISLVGAPHTVLSRDTSAALFRIVEVAASGTLQVSNVSIQDGNTAGLGGGILNAGTLRLSQVVLSGNRAGNGAGLSNSAGGTADITGTTFSGNTTTGVGGGIINSGTLTVTGSTFTANTAPINGGGLNTQSSGQSTLISSTFRQNTSGGLGGAISNLGTTTLIGTVVRQNRGFELVAGSPPATPTSPCANRPSWPTSRTTATPRTPSRAASTEAGCPAARPGRVRAAGRSPRTAGCAPPWSRSPALTAGG